MLEASLDAGERAGWVVRGNIALRLTAIVADEGDLEEARRLASTALTEVSRSKLPGGELVAAQLALEAGDIDEARAALERFGDRGVELLEPVQVVRDARALRLAVASDDLCRAEVHLTRLERRQLGNGDVWPILSALDDLHHAGVEHHRLASSLDLVDGFGTDEVDLLRAWVHEDADPGLARRSYESAIAAKRPPLSYRIEPLFRADVHAGLARLLARDGEQLKAMARLDEALASLDRWDGPRRDRSNVMRSSTGIPHLAPTQPVATPRSGRHVGSG